ncbi:hypothetical protein CPB86DRAFT_872559 [Serendipita vermifera]|nr:hypothetical protein CPB86DRAFT_872559 [Serendipita vermifera]
MISSIILALFWTRLSISQLVSPEYSCRTCNVVDLFLKGTNYGLSSACLPMSCDDSTITSLHGPSCISPRGESLVCNGTVLSSGWMGWTGHSVICDCDGPVSLTGLGNSSTLSSVGSFTIDPIDLAAYQPTDCSTASETEGPCNFKEFTNVYSYYEGKYEWSTTTECIALYYPPSNPQTPYYFDGTPLICDGSVHTSAANVTYICEAGKNLDVDTILSLYNPTSGPDSPTFIDCTSIRNSHGVMIDYRQALDQVRRNGIDLGPIINIVPT